MDSKEGKGVHSVNWVIGRSEETRLSNSEYTLILFILFFVIPKLNVL